MTVAGLVATWVKIKGMPSTRPNFLLITTDQQRFDTIGAAGNRAIWTPHLDWLCDTGVRFARAYADCPVCAPSRATIMTGLQAWHHGQTSNGGISPMAHLPTLPGLLTAAGYQTRAEGKMHFTPPRANYGFEHMRILPDYYREMARAGGPQPKEHGIGENEMVPVLATTDETRTVTHWTAQNSIDFLETRDDTRPFFLWTSFSKPHPPFDAPRSFWEIYDGLEMPDPVYGDWSRDVADIPPGFLSSTRTLNNLDRASPAQLRAIRRAYYACISHVDYSLGLLFARLRELNLLKDTWIFFASDHGEMLGDHHMGAKSVFFEGSAHVPLLVRPPDAAWPSDALAGSSDDRLACLADLLPTILERAEVTAPPHDGLDLMGQTRRDQIIGQCAEYHGVVWENWKFHFCERGGGELLFDLERDPMEICNRLQEAPAIAQKLREMLVESLAQRAHPAAINGKLVATSHADDERAQRAQSWPGFHSRGDQNCDLLH